MEATEPPGLFVAFAASRPIGVCTFQVRRIFIKRGDQRVRCLRYMLGVMQQDFVVGYPGAVEFLVVVEILAQSCSLERDSGEDPTTARPGKNLRLHGRACLCGGCSSNRSGGDGSIRPECKL